MKILFIILYLLTIPLHASSDDSRAESISSFFEDLTTAYNLKDYHKLAMFYDHNGRLFSLAGGIFRNDKTHEESGLSEVAWFFKDSFKRAPHQMVMKINAIEWISEDMALVDSVSLFLFAKRQVCSISSFVMKQSHSEWKIIRSMPSVPNAGHTRDHGRDIKWTAFCGLH